MAEFCVVSAVTTDAGDAFVFTDLVKQAQLAVKGDKSIMTVTVTNFGREIPPESLRAIFDPMVQLSVSIDQKGPASTSLGLGLFIAREITVAHGGSIHVESSARSGTVFTVKLPRSLDLRGDRSRGR